MAKVKLGNLTRRAVPSLRGAFYIRGTKCGAVAQAWPRKQSSWQRAFRYYQTAEFRIASNWVKTASAEQIATAMAMAAQQPTSSTTPRRKLPYTWRDILIAAFYGTIYEFVLPDGSVLLPAKDVLVSAQVDFDDITMVPWSIVYRTDTIWVGLMPGADGTLLTMTPLGPRWTSGYGSLIVPAGALLGNPTGVDGPAAAISLDTTLALAGAVLGRSRITGDVTIPANSNTAAIPTSSITYPKLQNTTATQVALGRNSGGAGAIEEITVTQILDWISSTAGSILKRGTSAWAASLQADLSSQAVSTSSATLALDRAAGEYVTLTLNNTITAFSVTNWGPSGTGSKLVLSINNTGSHDITTWPTGTKWQGGTQPTITSGAGKTDIITLLSHDGGSTIYGSVVGQDYS